MSDRHRLDYHVVDVFTDRPFAGNPLAVVLGGDALSTEQMQALALEFHLSETTFPLPPTNDEADYRVRIFTPGSELPFAGHPSVGTAWLLHRLGTIRGGRVVQECGAGLLPVEVHDAGATLTGGAPTAGDPVDAGPVLAAVGLSAADLAGPPPRRCGTGIDFHFLYVDDAAVSRARLDLAAVEALGSSGVSVFAYERESGRVHARVFAADVGEDPATGSAALGLGVFLAVSGLVPSDATTSYDVSQGTEMGRPSLLRCTVTTAGGEVTVATVSGHVEAVAAGSIAVP